MHQCYWLGVDRTRWARMVYAAGLGREYKSPCVTIPQSRWKGRIAALCTPPLSHVLVSLASRLNLTVFDQWSFICVTLEGAYCCSLCGPLWDVRVA